MNLKNIYQGVGFYIGCSGGSEYQSYYLITMSEGIVSRTIGIRLTLDEVNEIIASNGDAKIVSKIKSSKWGYIEIEPD